MYPLNPPIVYEMDIQDPKQVEDAVKAIKENHGNIDGVLHAIAFSPTEAMGGNFMNTELDDALASFEIPFLSEEGKEIPYNERKEWDYLFIIDPLDGTSNFLHGIPHWAISIALEHKNEITTGVIYDPIKDECFFAEKGNGAWLNDKRLRVSGRTQMIEMLFSTGIPFANKSGLSLTLKES